MPFINGRYYLNPVMGQALEAAREAEAALAALENPAGENSGGPGGDPDNDFGSRSGSPSGDGPIHRIEIDAAEMVPASSGRAARGYVARVHRGSGTAAEAAGTDVRRAGKIASGPETHVFSDHRDLMSFLRDQMEKDAQTRG